MKWSHSYNDNRRRSFKIEPFSDTCKRIIKKECNIKKTYLDNLSLCKKSKNKRECFCVGMRNKLRCWNRTLNSTSTYRFCSLSQNISAPDLHSFAISFLHTLPYIYIIYIYINTHTLFLNCASQCLEAGCASAVPRCRGQTSDRGLGLEGRTSIYFKIAVRFLRRTQQCYDLSREVLKPSRKTNNVQFKWSDKQPANYSRHVKSVKSSLPNLYSNVVFNSQKAFPACSLHLHAEIIACFLFLFPALRPSRSSTCWLY